jgi:hypothetical protein
MNPASVESQIDGFIAKFTPEMATNIVACRAKLRSFFPRGYELVFDNYNALVFGIAPSEKSKDSFLSIGAYPRWINLFFLRGATMHDPHQLLQGSGTQVRSIKLRSADDFDRSDIEELIREASADPQIAGDLRKAPPLATVVKLIAAKQRPRRPPTA